MEKGNPASPSRKQANLGLAGKLVVMAAGSFAFGYALVPLYDVFCEVTGIGSRDRLLQSAAIAETGEDQARTIVVEFVSSTPGTGAIEQSPLGGACDSTGVDPATGECVLGLAQSDSDLPGHFMAQKFRI